MVEGEADGDALSAANAEASGGCSAPDITVRGGAKSEAASSQPEHSRSQLANGITADREICVAKGRNNELKTASGK